MCYTVTLIIIVRLFLYLIIIFLSKSLSSYIESYYSLCDNVENQSDHAPVVLSLNINIDLHVCTPINHIPRKKWNNVSLDLIFLRR